MTDPPAPRFQRRLSAPATDPTGSTQPGTTAAGGDIVWFAETFSRLLANIGRAIKGKNDQVNLALLGLVSEGHILVEDGPGVGKTSLARAMAESISGSWRRIQCTADLLPSDITGVSIWDQAAQRFTFSAGPVFTNIVVADELNRAAPRAQAALLEVMDEGNVTVDGEPHPVPRPFVVIATQSPIEIDGTYPLPEAQLDRFLIKMSMGYPDLAAECDIVMSRRGGGPPRLEPVVSVGEVSRMIEISGAVRLDQQVVQYAVSLVGATRQMSDLRLGISPRGSLGLLRAAQSLAAAEGRTYVVVDDVKRLAVPVLAHRVLVTPDSMMRGVTAERVVAKLLSSVPVPGGAES